MVSVCDFGVDFIQRKILYHIERIISLYEIQEAKINTLCVHIDFGGDICTQKIFTTLNELYFLYIY